MFRPPPIRRHSSRRRHELLRPHILARQKSRGVRDRSKPLRPRSPMDVFGLLAQIVDGSTRRRGANEDENRVNPPHEKTSRTLSARARTRFMLSFRLE